jgi:hypothetical protein
MAWKKGPLPPNTWNWGGVVRVGDSPVYGFSFADFCGDHVDMVPGGTLKADEVGWYDNSIELPPGAPKTAKRLPGG